MTNLPLISGDRWVPRLGSIDVDRRCWFDHTMSERRMFNTTSMRDVFSTLYVVKL